MLIDTLYLMLIGSWIFICFLLLAILFGLILYVRGKE